MEIFFGLLLALLGAFLLFVGVRQFVKSNGWLFLTKAILVILTGLLFLGISVDPLKQIF